VLSHPLGKKKMRPFSTLASTAGNRKKSKHLLDSELVSLHSMLGQEAAGAAMGEGIRRLREGERLLLRQR